MKKYPYIPIAILSAAVITLLIVFYRTGMGYGSTLKFLFYPAIGAGCLGISSLISKAKFTDKKEKHGQLSYTITAGLIIFSLSVAGVNLYGMSVFEDEMNNNSIRSKAVIVDRVKRMEQKNKPKVNHDVYEFEYEGKRYREEFPDRQYLLQLGDTVIIVHSISDPSINSLANYDSTLRIK